MTRSSEKDPNDTPSEEEVRERIRRQMLENLNRSAVESADGRELSTFSEPGEHALEDAAALLKFAAYVATVPEKPEAEARELLNEARDLVAPLSLSRFTSAVKELRVMFLTLLPSEVPPESQSAPKIERSPENFLEWLTRLDLQRALVAEKKTGEANVERWLALDRAFGPPENFWTAFSRLR